ncbi:MAG: VOC family protein [Proteobacteria bacterium]|nr:VOC family protein [Pseudomonadota bacterium]
MIRGVHHTAISTVDLERSLVFYRDLLGFEMIMEAGWPVGTRVADRIAALPGSSARSAVLRVGSSIVELYQWTSPEPRPRDPEQRVCDHGITHICLDVTDIDAEYERLKSAGVEFHCEPQKVAKGVRCTYARDPDGNVVELQEVTWTDSPIALPFD